MVPGRVKKNQSNVTCLAALLVGDLVDAVNGEFDAVPGSGDGDLVGVLVGLGHVDLGGRVGLDPLQPLAPLAQDEAVVLLGDTQGLLRLGLHKKQNKKVNQRVPHVYLLSFHFSSLK